MKERDIKIDTRILDAILIIGFLVLGYMWVVNLGVMTDVLGLLKP